MNLSRCAPGNPRSRRSVAADLDLLNAMERAWLAARRAGPGRRRDAHDRRAVDVLAAPVAAARTEQGALDYTALEAAMAHLDAVVRQTRHALRAIADGTLAGAGR